MIFKKLSNWEKIFIICIVGLIGMAFYFLYNRNYSMAGVSISFDVLFIIFLMNSKSKHKEE